MLDFDRSIWTEEALGESEELLARVVKTNVDGLIVVGTDERITFLNAAAERLLGVSRDKITGQPHTDPSFERMRSVAYRAIFSKHDSHSRSTRSRRPPSALADGRGSSSTRPVKGEKSS